MQYPKSRSQYLDRRREDVAGATLRPDELRVAWIDLELASQSQNLDVHAAIEHFLVVHAAGGEQLNICCGDRRKAVSRLNSPAVSAVVFAFGDTADRAGPTGQFGNH